MGRNSRVYSVGACKLILHLIALDLPHLYEVTYVVTASLDLPKVPSIGAAVAHFINGAVHAAPPAHRVIPAHVIVIQVVRRGASE